MFKRMAAGLCCLLLVFQLAAPVRAEAGYICFVAAGESILPLSDSTMPFWHNGYLYIASSIFTGVGREALNIGRISNSGQVILYSSGRSLWFEKEKGYAHDTDGNTYYPGGVQRNGEMYVPASVVAQFFGLQYSVTDVKISAAGSQVRGDLAWIRQSGSVLTEQMFVNAASFTIASRYMDYLKEQEDETTDLTPEVPTGVEVEGKRFYLCLACLLYTSHPVQGVYTQPLGGYSGDREVCYAVWNESEHLAEIRFRLDGGPAETVSISTPPSLTIWRFRGGESGWHLESTYYNDAGDEL